MVEYKSIISKTHPLNNPLMIHQGVTVDDFVN